MEPSHYDILGVSCSAPPEAIERAYRALIARTVRASGAEAEVLRREARLARVAFAELMDPDRRAAYDARVGIRSGRHASQGDAPRATEALAPSDRDWRFPTLGAGLVALVALMGLGSYALPDIQRTLRSPQAAVRPGPVRVHSEAGVSSKPLGIVSSPFYVQPGARGGR